MTVNGGENRGPEYQGRGSAGAPGLGPWRPVPRRMPGDPDLILELSELSKSQKGKSDEDKNSLCWVARETWDLRAAPHVTKRDPESVFSSFICKISLRS